MRSWLSGWQTIDRRLLLILLLAVLPSRAPFAAGAETNARDYVLMVFMKPLESREREYFDWYQGQHIRDVVRHPDFVSARMYRAVASPAFPGNDHPNPVLIEYGIRSADLASAFAEDGKLSAQARLDNPPHDAQATRSFTFQADAVLAQSSPGKAQADSSVNAITHKLFVLESPLAGKEEALHRWHAEQAQQMIKLDGVLQVQRFVRSSVQRYSGSASPVLMTVYSLSGNDPATVFAQMQKRGITLIANDLVDTAATQQFVFQAIMPLLLR